MQGVVNFDFLFDTMPPKWMFLCRVQCDTLFWLKQNAYLLSQMFSMCHCEMPPTWMSLMTEVVNVKPFFG